MPHRDLARRRHVLLPLLVALAVSAPTGVAAEDAPDAVVETLHGAFVIRLLPDLAPAHVAHFLKVVRTQGFDGTTFHRLIAGGIIQGGDPLSRDPALAARYGTGGLGLLKAEFSDRPFVRGVVAAVRRPSSVDSAGDQFFVVLADQPSLLGQYTIFGEVVEGLEVADKIGMSPVDGERARERIEMTITLREAAATAAPEGGAR